jgi:CubicO group peptidase (beta-lactamase class C family)
LGYIILREKIFVLLGMKDSGYDHPWIVMKNRAAGYGRRDGTLANCIHFEMDTPHAAGALYSTVEDLLLWDQALFREHEALLNTTGAQLCQSSNLT